MLNSRDPNPIYQPRQFWRSLLRYNRWPRTEALRRKLRSDPNTYAAFFANLITSQPGARLTGDLTPSYGALPTGVLQEVHKSLEGHGFDVRGILILRDPVERCLSASRMYQDRAWRRGKAKEFSDRAINISDNEHPFTQLSALRTRYDRILKTADSIFLGNTLFVSFYEELFSTAEMARMCDWQMLESQEADFKKRVNSSCTPKKPLDPALRARIANYYRPVYEDMFLRFGEDRIRGLWPSAALLK